MVEACTERLALREVVGVASPLAIVSRSVDGDRCWLKGWKIPDTTTVKIDARSTSDD